MGLRFIDRLGSLKKIVLVQDNLPILERIVPRVNGSAYCGLESATLTKSSNTLTTRISRAKASGKCILRSGE